MGWSCTNEQSKTLEKLMKNEDYNDLKNRFIEFIPGGIDWGTAPYEDMPVRCYQVMRSPMGSEIGWIGAGYFLIKPDGSVVNRSRFKLDAEAK